MKTEVPIFRRCCFCIPLRYGLLTWGYLSLVLNTLLLITYGFEFEYMSRRADYYHAFDIFRVVVGFTDCVAGYSLTFLLIVALHKKNIKHLEVYKASMLVCILISALLIIAGFIADIGEFWTYPWIWKYYICDVFSSVLCIGLDLYIIALVRSEIIKLNNSINFEFSNLAAAAESAYYADNEPTNKLNNVIVEKNENEQLDVNIDNREHAKKETNEIIKKNNINVLKNNLPLFATCKNIRYDKVVDME